MDDDYDLQAWLDEQSAAAAKEEAERKARARSAQRWTWDETLFNFRVDLYRQAIGA